jgi:hypothetical protein
MVDAWSEDHRLLAIGGRQAPPSCEVFQRPDLQAHLRLRLANHSLGTSNRKTNSARDHQIDLQASAGMGDFPLSEGDFSAIIRKIWWRNCLLICLPHFVQLSGSRRVNRLRLVLHVEIKCYQMISACSTFIINIQICLEQTQTLKKRPA